MPEAGVQEFVSTSGVCELRRLLDDRIYLLRVQGGSDYDAERNESRESRRTTRLLFGFVSARSAEHTSESGLPTACADSWGWCSCASSDSWY